MYIILLMQITDWWIDNDAGPLNNAQFSGQRPDIVKFVFNSYEER